MQFDIHRKGSTASTNDDVWQLAQEGAHPGAVVVASSQRAGRGQWGRVWVSPEGGLYFSVLLRPRIPESTWPGLSGRIAEAVACVIRAECGVGEDDVWVKLPNDVKCAEGKLCGMSLDAKGGLVVLGCGVNVFHSDRPVETDGRNVPAYMCDLGNLGLPSTAYLDALLIKLLNAIDATGLF